MTLSREHPSRDWIIGLKANNERRELITVDFKDMAKLCDLALRALDQDALAEARREVIDKAKEVVWESVDERGSHKHSDLEKALRNLESMEASREEGKEGNSEQGPGIWFLVILAAACLGAAISVVIVLL